MLTNKQIMMVRIIVAFFILAGVGSIVWLILSLSHKEPIDDTSTHTSISATDISGNNLSSAPIDDTPTSTGRDYTVTDDLKIIINLNPIAQKADSAYVENAKREYDGETYYYWDSGDVLYGRQVDSNQYNFVSPYGTASTILGDLKSLDEWKELTLSDWGMDLYLLDPENFKDSYDGAYSLVKCEEKELCGYTVLLCIRQDKETLSYDGRAIYNTNKLSVVFKAFNIESEDALLEMVKDSMLQVQFTKE